MYRNILYKRNPVRLLDSKGFTVIEGILAMSILILSLFALLRFFSYGAMFVERDGIRRQALALLQGRLEQIHAHSKWGARELAVLDGDTSVAMVVVANGEKIAIPATISTTIIGDKSDGNLRYDSVSVAVLYNHVIIRDTIEIGTKFYREPEEQ